MYWWPVGSHFFLCSVAYAFLLYDTFPSCNPLLRIYALLIHVLHHIVSFLAILIAIRKLNTGINGPFHVW